MKPLLLPAAICAASLLAACGGGSSLSSGTAVPPAGPVQNATGSSGSISRPSVSAASAAVGTNAIPSGQGIYVANAGNRTVTEYAATAPGVPLRTILLAATPSRLSINTSGTLAVLEGTSVEVFAPGTTVAARTIAGSNTGFVAPAGILIDDAGYVIVEDSTTGTTGNSIAFRGFAPSANGNAAPVRVSIPFDNSKYAPGQQPTDTPLNLGTGQYVYTSRSPAGVTSILYANGQETQPGFFTFDPTEGPFAVRAGQTPAPNTLAPSVTYDVGTSNANFQVFTLNQTVGSGSLNSAPLVNVAFNSGRPIDATIQGSNTTFGDLAGGVAATDGTLFIADQNGGCATGDIAVFPRGAQGNVAPTALIGSGSTGIDQPIAIIIGTL